MAEGVSKAAVAIPFMTPAYEQSENCALELKFAKQVRNFSSNDEYRVLS